MAVLLSRITGMVREMVMARLFGAGLAYDAFLLGFRIPNLARNLFAEGALSSAFVPGFTRQLAKGRQEAEELSNLVGTALVAIVSAVCFAGIFFAPCLVSLLAPGYAAVPGKFEVAVRLTRIMFPFLLLVTLAAQAMGVLNACNQFGVPALASVFFNLGSISFGIGLALLAARPLHLELVDCMAYGVVFGGALQLGWQVPALIRSGFVFRFRWNFSHPALRSILAMIGPAIMGNAAVQINTIVNTNLASSITDAAGHVLNGPVSWLGYAFRFMQMPLGIFGVAIGSATLPWISRAAVAGRIEDFRHTLSRSLGIVMLLAVPASVGLSVLGRSMVAAVYQWGRFSEADTQETALALTGYAVGLAGYAAMKVLIPAFYALDDARTPMLVSIASILANFALASGLVRLAGLRHFGLALSTSLVASLTSALLYAILRRRLGGIASSRLDVTAVKIAAGAALMGMVCTISSRIVQDWLGSSKPALLADLAVSIPLACAVYYFACRAFRVPGLADLQQTFRETLRRRLSMRRATLQ